MLSKKSSEEVNSESSSAFQETSRSGLNVTKQGVNHGSSRENSSGTALAGATVSAETVQAEVGGNLTIESRQDTSTFKSEQDSSGWGVSLCIPPFCYGASSISASGGAQKIESEFASVNEQSGLRAGDGGFQVNVGKNTTLTGGAITSTDKAVQDDRNRFATGGELTTSDMENHASYKAEGYSVNVSVSGKLGDQDSTTAREGMSDKEKAAADVRTAPANGSAGIGEDSGEASSTTLAAISGIAGNKGARTGDEEAGIQPIFDKDRVQKEIDAQIKITAEFGKNASKAIGDYATKMYNDLKDSDPDEAAKWAEGGIYRVGLHTLVGGFSGGGAGAAGALTSQITIDLIAIEIATLDIPDELRATLIAAAGATVGATVGNGAGASSAFNATVNNFLKHSTNWRASQWGSFKEELVRCKATTDCNVDTLYARWAGVSNELQKLAMDSMDAMFGVNPAAAADAGKYFGSATAAMNMNPADICDMGDSRCYGFVQQQNGQAAAVFRYGLTTAYANDLVDYGSTKTVSANGTSKATPGPKTTPDDMLPEADFAGRIPTRADLQDHMVNGAVSGRQISGGHNMNNFETTLSGAGGTVVSKVEVAPGIYEMEYTLPKGQGRAPETKTVYDPTLYSDTQMSAMASEAAARAQIQFQATGVKGQYVQIQGVWFYAPVKTNRSGKVVGIQTVFPKRPQE